MLSVHCTCIERRRASTWRDKSGNAIQKSTYAIKQYTHTHSKCEWNVTVIDVGSKMI